MNKVDIYIDSYLLDLFQDEQISINLSTQNIRDISKIFTDFTQTFTVPASAKNNEILAHYFRTDVDVSRITSRKVSGYPVWEDIVTTWGSMTGAWESGSVTETSVPNPFDFRLRQEGRIEINKLPFRTGVLELDSVEMRGTEPYSYSLAFYGDITNLTDLFGEDYLYDLDLSNLDHNYDGATIKTGITAGLKSGDVVYPLWSPVRTWFYNASTSSHDDDNIHYHTGGTHSGAHGIEYHELKPGIKVKKILEAMEDKYGIVLVGDFITTAPFSNLFLWAHRNEGYMYQGQPTGTQYEKVIFDQTNGPTPDYYNLTTNVFNVQEGPTGSGDVYDIYYQIDFPVYADDVYLAVVKNGVTIAEQVFKGAAPASGTFENIPITNYFDNIWIQIRPSTNVPMVYEFYQLQFTKTTGSEVQGDVFQSTSVTYDYARVTVTSLMPEIKVAEFMSGLIKMFNWVLIPESPTRFNIYTLDEWYADGTNRNYQAYIDVQEVSVQRPPIYRRINFKYQDTEQVLGYEYRRQNSIAYGELRADFNFDGEELEIQLPFECPLLTRLTDQNNLTILTPLLIYFSQTREIERDTNRLQTYLGKPILFYARTPAVSLSGFPVSYIPESGTQESLDSYIRAHVTLDSPRHTLTWGTQIDPLDFTTITETLYQEYWNDYITDLYDYKRRMFVVKAQLPIGEILKLKLNDKLVWNNSRWIINAMQVNLTTGQATIEMLNDVTIAPQAIGPAPNPNEGPTPQEDGPPVSPGETPGEVLEEPS